MKPRDFRVENLMSTALITASPDEAVDAADFDMKLARVRHLPVMGESGDLVGVISDRDVLRSVSRLGKRSAKVKDIMTSEVVTVSANDPASRALELMLEHKFGCLPVEGDDGRLIGLITETDFLELTYRIVFKNGNDEGDEGLGSFEETG